MFQRINKQVASELLERTEAILIDIRDAESYSQGHHEKALHLTQEGLPDFLNSAEKTSPVLVMCYHGNSSQSVAHYLTLQGFTEVYSIDGGYEGWIED